MRKLREIVVQAARLWRTTVLWGLLALCLAGAPAQAAEPLERRVDQLEVQDLLQAGKIDALDAKVDDHFVLLNAKIDQIAAVQDAKIDALTLIVEALSAQVARLEIAMWSGFGFILAVTTLLFAVVMHQVNALNRRVDGMQQSMDAMRQSMDAMRQSLDRLQETQQAILMHLAGVQQLPEQQAETQDQPQQAPGAEEPQQAPGPEEPQQAASPKQGAQQRAAAVAQRAAL